MTTVADPISERVICALVGRLQMILRESGYLTDAGERVFRARASVMPADLPCIVVWDGGESAEKADGSSGSMSIRQTVIVEAHAAADLADTGAVIGALKADIKRALLGWARDGGVKDAIGRSTGPLTYNGAEMSPRAGSGVSEAAALTFTATYREGYGDPAAAL